MENNWKPAVGEDYWLVGESFEPIRETNDGVPGDDEIINSGNCFKTKEEAQAVADKFRKLLNGEDITPSAQSEDTLPDWCETAEFLYDYNEETYARICESEDNHIELLYAGASEPDVKSADYVNGCCVEAQVTPYTEAQLIELVGQVIYHADGDVSLCTDYTKDDGVYIGNCWYTAKEIINSDWYLAGFWCCNLSHKDSDGNQVN